MPPTSNVRKAPATTSTATLTNDPSAPPRRTTSGRAVRANTTRPSNYYARPFNSFTANNAAQDADDQDGPAPGFFPALTFFTDAISALPKEVMRQFTLMKEVEAKIYGNNEKLGDVVDDIMTYPVPARNVSGQVGSGGEAGTVVAGQGMLSLTANNSVTGSTSVSLINGVAPNAGVQHSAQNSVAGSWNGEDVSGQVGSEEELVKRQKYHELRTLVAGMLPNLDEKGVVLSEANRILNRQHMRIDSVWPHLDAEISDEARYGSMSHWAYSDNRQRKQVAGTAANRRDVAATNNLAAAANAIHEHEIATARRDAVREGREKHKGRGKEQIDSDFDDRPKKTHAKIAKSKPGPAGLGISANGEPVKRRKLDKGLAAPGMERSVSTKGAKKEARSNTPVAEGGKKPKTKPAPLPAKRKGLSAHASPALASSPLHSSFASATMEPPGGRPQSSRVRGSSNATNLRHEKLASEEGSRPTSAPGKAERGNGKRKAPDDVEDETKAKKTIEGSDSLARDEVVMAGGEVPPASRSHSNSGKAGRGSATGTPRTENFPDGVGPATLKRTRSTRSGLDNQENSSSEPQVQGRHKRMASNSHLVKQLASFNRSPDAGRDKDDMDEELDSTDERRLEREGEGGGGGGDENSRSPRKPRPISRRNTLQQITSTTSPAPEDGVSAYVQEAEDTTMADPPASPTPTAATSPPPLSPEAPTQDQDQPSPTPSSEPAEEPADAGDVATYSDEEIDERDEIDIDDDEEGDPDDPNEPKYCYCNRGSYGEMIACDNEQCPREWFHFGCTGLREPPEEEEKWYCDDCRPIFMAVGRGRGRGRGGRGRG